MRESFAIKKLCDKRPMPINNPNYIKHHKNNTYSSHYLLQSLLGVPWNSVSGEMQSPLHNAARSESESQRIEDLMISISSLDFATKAKAVVELGRLRVTEAIEPLIKLLFSDDDELKVHVSSSVLSFEKCHLYRPLSNSSF